MERIGIFDSGIGGLTTLCSIQKALGGGDYVYLADDVSAPFGTKSEVELMRIGSYGVETLVGLGCKHIVLACNTLTATCKQKLVERFNVNIIGTEPALKPAVSECTKVALLATPSTIASKRVQELLLTCRGQVTCYPHYNLAGIIEGVSPDWKIMKGYIRKNCHYLDGYDGLVLGCTHYVHIKSVFEETFPHLKVFDGNDGVGRRVLSFTGKASGGSVKVYTTSRCGEERYMRILKEYKKIAKNV